jgi:hypothetical protein
VRIGGEPREPSRFGDILTMHEFRAKQRAGAAGMLRNLAVLAVAGVTLSACGGGSMFGAGSASSGPSMTDRFSQLFGGKSTEVGAPQSPQTDENDLTCPSVAIRPGASTYQVAAPGKQPIGNDLRYQATITRTARDCNITAGQITVRIGIQGRVIAGPSGAPATVEVPLRVAVVQEGVTPKTIITKVYKTTVQMGWRGRTVRLDGGPKPEATALPFGAVRSNGAASASRLC